MRSITNISIVFLTLTLTEMAKLGHDVSKSYVHDVLRKHGLLSLAKTDPRSSSPEI